MSDTQRTKVGLISCSGEELPEGTLSRTAVRLVLEKLRPDKTVTICLPLFLSGEQGERNFAKNFPTIVVDGCGKGCARIGTERYSGKVDDVIVVAQLVKEWGETITFTRRALDEAGWKLAWRIAEDIAGKVDALLEKHWESTASATAEDSGPVCSCMKGGPPRTTTIEVEGKRIDLVALEMVIRLVARMEGLSKDSIREELLKQVKVYNGPLEGIREEALKQALYDAYESPAGKAVPRGKL